MKQSIDRKQELHEYKTNSTYNVNATNDEAIEDQGANNNDVEFQVDNIKVDCVPGSHDVIPSSWLYDDNHKDNITTITTPEIFQVHLRTSIDIENDIIFEINRSWSPIGVDRFYQLINDHYYNCAAFFRIVPDFVIQFGIAAEPSETKKWDQISIPDDPVMVSNTIGTISYATAGPNTRTTQLFINTNDNHRLDSLGFTPIGKVMQGLDMLQQLIYNPTPGNSNGIDQASYSSFGNEWILQKYPEIDIIVNVTLTLESE